MDAIHEMNRGLMMGACIAYLKRAYRFNPNCTARIQQFERTATLAEIGRLYTTITMLEEL